MENLTHRSGRRYDIDWLRVIAIGLLLIYHVAIGFQAWGRMIGFITSREPWAALWLPMALLNIWRIPLLFFVSGMGVYYAMQSRTWSQLILERTRRILLPFVFGIFAIVPLHLLVWRWYYSMDLNYSWDPGHLWFLGNIFSYVVLLFPIFYLIKKHESGTIIRWIKATLSKPWGLVLVWVCFAGEALAVDPMPFELYAGTWHGFVLGLLAFFFGFCFVLTGDGFWKMVQKWRWVFLIAGMLLYFTRMGQVWGSQPGYLLTLESFSWILTVFAFSSLHLNKSGQVLAYLSQAAYPVYILHMVFLYLGSAWIFPLAIPVQLQFVLVLLITFIGSFGTFELIRRITLLRPLFGLK